MCPWHSENNFNKMSTERVTMYLSEMHANTGPLPATVGTMYIPKCMPDTGPRNQSINKRARHLGMRIQSRF